MAHLGVRPIRRLRDATKQSISPPHYQESIRSENEDEETAEGNTNMSQCSKKRGFLVRLKNLSQTGRRKSKLEKDEDNRRREFKIPGKVEDRKHFIHDELTDLTTKFNEMSDE